MTNEFRVAVPWKVSRQELIDLFELSLTLQFEEKLPTKKPGFHKQKLNHRGFCGTREVEKKNKQFKKTTFYVVTKCNLLHFLC